MMRCADCGRTLEVGDRYIVDTSSGFTNSEANPVVDDVIAGIFGGADGKVYFCEDCTEPGGDYHFETVYGDEAEAGNSHPYAEGPSADTREQP